MIVRRPADPSNSAFRDHLQPSLQRPDEAHCRWLRCLPMSCIVVGRSIKVADNCRARTLLACRMIPRAWLTARSPRLQRRIAKQATAAAQWTFVTNLRGGWALQRMGCSHLALTRLARLACMMARTFEACLRYNSSARVAHPRGVMLQRVTGGQDVSAAQPAASHMVLGPGWC